MKKNKICILLSVNLSINLNLFTQIHLLVDKVPFEITPESNSIIYVNDDTTTGSCHGTMLRPYFNIPEGLTSIESGLMVYVLPSYYLIANYILLEQSEAMFLNTSFDTGFNSPDINHINNRFYFNHLAIKFR
jgi:hypothetical protein